MGRIAAWRDMIYPNAITSGILWIYYQKGFLSYVLPLFLNI